MKKAAILMITVLCTLCLLTACGSSNSKETEPETTAPTAAPTTAATETATETATEAPTAAATEASEASDAETVNSGLETAQKMYDQPIEDLIAIIGEPESREYAPSCLIDGEDGILHYDGFTVYTLRYENGEEVINFAE